ncbi:MAG: hypothetical protein IGQ45_05380 [Cyanobacterium sp. T60_A2020_053]|nr:hypothetical protein [Cyanobacterium sp. T60_A2020_053]
MIITTNFQQQFNYINPQELQQKLANNSVLLIDVREKNERSLRQSPISAKRIGEG